MIIRCILNFQQAREIVINLLNVNPSTDKNLENEVIAYFYQVSMINFENIEFIATCNV